MLTRWGETLDKNNVLGEYPRPQMRRSSFINLNGLWDYAFTAAGEKQPDKWYGKILVPFSPRVRAVRRRAHSLPRTSTSGTGATGQSPM